MICSCAKSFIIVFLRYLFEPLEMSYHRIEYKQLVQVFEQMSYSAAYRSLLEYEKYALNKGIFAVQRG